MLKYNKSNYCFVALKRKRKKEGLTYDLVVAIKSKHNKYFVLEKLGSYCLAENRFVINFNKFCYWSQFNLSMTSFFHKIIYNFLFN